MRDRCAGSRNGFALVVTLSLLILLTLIAVGLLSLSSISLRRTSLAGVQSEAQSNARLSITLAIGELQRTLGPDQRVNASASILDSPDSTNPSSLRHPHLTGVWQARNEKLGEVTDYDRESPFIGWLVSGPQDELGSISFAENGDFQDPVTLVGEQATSANSAPPREVRAGLIKVRDTGGAAWWVGDENSKGYMKGTDLNERKSPLKVTDLLARVGTPGPHGMEAIFDNYESNTDLADKVISLDSLDLAKKGLSARDWFHDLTPYARGVLTNVVDGGLRKDLSLYLEGTQRLSAWPSPSLDPIGPNGKYALSEVDDYDVLAWKQLIHFNGYRKRLNKVGGRPSITAWDGLARTPDDYQNPRWNAGVLRPAPVLIRCQIFISFGSVPDPDPAHAGKLALRFYTYPVMTYWNPYNVDLVVNNLTNLFHAMPMEHIVSINGVRRDSYNWRTTNGSGIKPTVDRPITFKPGEALMLSPTRGSAPRPWSWVAGHAQHYAHYLAAIPFDYSPNFAGGEWGERRSGDPGMTRAYGRPSDIVEIDTDVTFQASWNARNIQETWSIRGGQYDTSENNYQTYLWSNRLSWRYESGNTTSLTTPDKLSSTNLPRATFAEILNAPRPFMVIDAKLKALDEVGLPNKTWRDCVPSHPFQALTKGSEGVTPFYASAYKLSFETINSYQEAANYLQTSPDGEAHTYFGGSHFPGGGQSFITAQEIPTAPFTSLAQLQHVPQTSIDNLFSSSYFFQNYAIGNSYATPGVKSDHVRSPGWPFTTDVYIDKDGGDISGKKYPYGTYYTRPNIDRSYAANHLLWDDYFFSSLAGQDSVLHDVGSIKTVGQVAKEFFVDGKPLPNERYSPYVKGDAEGVARSLAKGNRVTAQATIESAKYLMVDGAFNINSVSVPAWKTMLAAAHRKRMVILDAHGGPPHVEEPRNFVVSRFSMPNGGSSEAANGREAQDLRWRGYRELSTNQIDELARAVVRQVKMRGPFRSLAEFINRRLADESDERSLYGALQGALEDPKVSINEDYQNITIKSSDLKGISYQNMATATGPSFQGSPPYVSQADLLNSIGPVISARSDTFVIRGYGESRDKSGKVLSRAWCEAIVQRIPDYLDLSDDAHLATESLNSEINQEFGRRIKTVAFRWLTPEEI